MPLTGLTILFLSVAVPCLATLTLDDSYSNTCSDHVIFQRIRVCRERYNLPNWILSLQLCKHLECYLSCIDDILSTCGQLPQFHVHDVRIRRVQARYFCSRPDFHLSATQLCYVEYVEQIFFQLIVPTEALIVSAHTEGRFDDFLLLSCGLYEIHKTYPYIFEPSPCPDEMRSYAFDHDFIQNSPAACVDQNHTLFLKYGHAPNCVNDVDIPTDNTDSSDVEDQLFDNHPNSSSVTIRYHLPTKYQCQTQILTFASYYCNLAYNEDVIQLMRFCLRIECSLQCYQDTLQYCLYWYPVFISDVAYMRVKERLQCEAPSATMTALAKCGRAPCLMKYMERLQNSSQIGSNRGYCSDSIPILNRCEGIFTINADCSPRMAKLGSEAFVADMQCRIDYFGRYKDRASKEPDIDTCYVYQRGNDAPKIVMYFGTVVIFVCIYLIVKGFLINYGGNNSMVYRPIRSKSRKYTIW